MGFVLMYSCTYVPYLWVAWWARFCTYMGPSHWPITLSVLYWPVSVLCTLVLVYWTVLHAIMGYNHSRQVFVLLCVLWAPVIAPVAILLLMLVVTVTLAAVGYKQLV